MPDEQLTTAERMAEASEDLRKLGHVQGRIGKDLALKFQHFCESRGYTKSKALKIILSKFFN